MERKEYESIRCYTHIVTLNSDLIHDLKSRNSAMGCQIDMERKDVNR